MRRRDPSLKMGGDILNLRVSRVKPPVREASLNQPTNSMVETATSPKRSTVHSPGIESIVVSPGPVVTQRFSNSHSSRESPINSARESPRQSARESPINSTRETSSNSVSRSQRETSRISPSNSVSRSQREVPRSATPVVRSITPRESPRARTPAESPRTRSPVNRSRAPAESPRARSPIENHRARSPVENPRARTRSPDNRAPVENPRTRSPVNRAPVENPRTRTRSPVNRAPAENPRTRSPVNRARTPAESSRVSVGNRNRVSISSEFPVNHQPTPVVSSWNSGRNSNLASGRGGMISATLNSAIPRPINIKPNNGMFLSNTDEIIDVMHSAVIEAVDDEMLVREKYKIQFGILREVLGNDVNYPGDNIAIHQIKKCYDAWYEHAQIHNTMVKFMAFSVAGVIAIEFICTRFLGLNCTGYAQMHLRVMDSMKLSFFELAQKYTGKGKSSWPIEARLGFTFLLNAIVFIGLNMIADTMGMKHLVETGFEYYGSIFMGLKIKNTPESRNDSEEEPEERVMVKPDIPDYLDQPNSSADNSAALIAPPSVPRHHPLLEPDTVRNAGGMAIGAMNMFGGPSEQPAPAPRAGPRYLD